MKRISTYLSAVLIVCTTLLATPKNAYAGSGTTIGTSEESSGYSGAFHPFNQEIRTEVAPNTNINFERGSLTAPSETLNKLDKIASDIREQFQNVNNKNDVVIDLMLGSTNASVAGVQFKTALVELGANPDRVEQLKNALSNLVPSCQSESCSSVNINQLNQVINAYNQLVRTSSPQVLVKISRHPYFKSTFAQLKQMRQALSRR
ncbi:hypothetical protein NIES4071_62900 [Calothrix sp. NIES-4071]|nr:hypothetical protein NIES4071_62900 [Calothrix sp. NIES-4071]BAZ60593.1 hypothetical protein NIES4105_62850 [Calothrix sp. NIES-4105]